MHQTLITFPDLQLSARDGHKLRGYFSRLFGEESDLWHNHREDGRPIYRYPLIQYKVVKGVPMLLGLAEGAPLLIQHFLDVQEIQLEEIRLPVHSKQVKSKDISIGADGELYRYSFENPWFALNQENYQKFLGTPAEKKETMLKKTLIGHILAFFKGVGHWEKSDISILPIYLQPVTARFKDRQMMMFKGEFVSNVRLPDYIGLGKSVSRGFGTIMKVKD